VAAWLAGSFGRGEPDPVSDLDLNLVVCAPHHKTLCARPAMASAGSTPERLALFSRFGQPAVIHENNHNAPPGGTFTFVLYAGSALMVDWILLPKTAAQRSAETLLLFDHAGIPIQDPEGNTSASSADCRNLASRAEKASEQLAFFWMMAAVAAKYLLREDAAMVQWILEMLARALAEIDRLLAGEPYRHRRGAYAPLAPAREQQVQALQEYMERANERAAQVLALGGRVPENPAATVGILLGLAEGD
jgi:hypothetical protein